MLADVTKSISVYKPRIISPYFHSQMILQNIIIVINTIVAVSINLTFSQDDLKWKVTKRNNSYVSYKRYVSALFVVSSRFNKLNIIMAWAMIFFSISTFIIKTFSSITHMQQYFTSIWPSGKQEIRTRMRTQILSNKIFNFPNSNFLKRTF